MALTANRNTKEVYCNAECIHRVRPVAEGTAVYTGSIVAVNSSGYACPAADTEGLVVLGRCEDILPGNRVIIKSGVFVFNNSTASGQTLTAADINREVYVIDDETVGKTSSGNIVAGVLREIISPAEVVVEIGNQSI